MFNTLSKYIFGSSYLQSEPQNLNKNPESDNIKSEQTPNETDIDGWLIVDTEEKEDSLPRTDSEEEIPFVEIKRTRTSNRNNNLLNYQRSRSNSTPSVNQDELPQRFQANSRKQSRPLRSSMDESWFLTPPACFTSTGPVHMEASPFENLLIEHPSMSVYHSIREMQDTSESFVDINMNGQEPSKNVIKKKERNAKKGVVPTRREEVKVFRPGKEGILLHSSQKVHDQRARKNVGRTALMRTNKVRDFNKKCGRPRRSDLQHCKSLSGANNNRKC